jgi:hypothetical protein
MVNQKCPHENCIGTFHFDDEAVGSILVNNAEGKGPAHANCPHCNNEVYFHTDASGEGLTPHSCQYHN